MSVVLLRVLRFSPGPNGFWLSRTTDYYEVPARVGCQIYLHWKPWLAP